MKPIKHVLLLVLVFAASFTAHAQSTAFTYQGRLAASGLPYTGLAEMQFALFDTPAGGAALASNTPTVVSVNVSAGLFTTSLDFGSANFRGADRWLEIQVRTNLGAFFTLSPRQPLTPAPSALFANIAGTVTNNSITGPQVANNAINAAHIAGGQVVKSLNGLKDSVNLVAGTNVTVTTNGSGVSVSAGPWLPNGSDTFFNGGNVGIGTNSPQAKLHVTDGDILAGAPGQEWVFHTRSFAGSDFLHITDSDDGVYQFQRGLVINQSGNVGIGITAPIAGLHIKKEPIPPGGTLALDGDTHTYLTFFPKGATNGRKGYIGFASSNAFDLSIANEFPIGRIALFDSSGVNFPAAGIENLRVVRGSVAASGSSLSGGGYSVSHPVTGFYQITFSPDFNGHPVVTASADVNSSGEHRYATVSTPNFDDPIGVFIQDIPTGNLVDNKFNFIAIGGR